MLIWYSLSASFDVAYCCVLQYTDQTNPPVPFVEFFENTSVLSRKCMPCTVLVVHSHMLVVQLFFTKCNSARFKRAFPHSPIYCTYLESNNFNCNIFQKCCILFLSHLTKSSRFAYCKNRSVSQTTAACQIYWFANDFRFEVNSNLSKVKSNYSKEFTLRTVSHSKNYGYFLTLD